MYGFPDEKQRLSKNCRDYWQYRERLCVVDGVILLDQRMVIPKGLRLSVLQAVHSAHQGTSGMTSRAQGCVFWARHISKTRNQCEICNRICTITSSHAPNQVQPSPLPLPSNSSRLLFSMRCKVLGSGGPLQWMATSDESNRVR